MRDRKTQTRRSATGSATASRREDDSDWQRCALLGANCVRLIVRGVGVADPTEAVDRVGKRVEEELAIRIDEGDVLPRVAPARDVEPRRSRSRQVDSESRPTPQLLPEEAASDCAGGVPWRQSGEPDLSSQDLAPSPRRRPAEGARGGKACAGSQDRPTRPGLTHHLNSAAMGGPNCAYNVASPPTPLQTVAISATRARMAELRRWGGGTVASAASRLIISIS